MPCYSVPLIKALQILHQSQRESHRSAGTPEHDDPAILNDGIQPWVDNRLVMASISSKPSAMRTSVLAIVPPHDQPI